MYSKRHNAEALPALHAMRICQALSAGLDDAPLAGRVHSVFANAVNIETTQGLVSLLTRGRSLLPFSVVLDTRSPFPSLGWEGGLPLILDKRGIFVSDGTPLVLLQGARPTELKVCRRLQQTQCLPSAAPLVRWLTEHADENGLSPLVTRQGSNPYVQLIETRLPALYAAVASENSDAAAQAAERMAGCGVGLTPSSDDLLCGYMTLLHALSACGFGMEPSVLLPLTKTMAQHAAKKTTAISAAFLLQSGNGYASDDLLTLLALLFGGADEAALHSAADRVGSFGSTSGADILTGATLALLQFSRDNP